MGLTRKDLKGSKYRCLLLSSLPNVCNEKTAVKCKKSSPTMIQTDKESLKEVIKRLCRLPEILEIKDDFLYYPQGFSNPKELKLTENMAKDIFSKGRIDYIDFDKFKEEVRDNWWLAHPRGANTPNWDFVCTCTINRKPGLILVEAKAYEGEFKPDKKEIDPNAKIESKNNHIKITEAIEEASIELNRYSISNGFNLSIQEHYQLSNRFAFSWKLASLGIPIILIYLGFINAQEMGSSYFQDQKHWESYLLRSTSHIVPKNVWGSEILVGGSKKVPIYPIIRSMEMFPFPLIKEINGEQCSF